MSYQFAPEKDEKCKGTVKKTRTRIKSIGELEDDDSDVETRKRAATFKDKSIYQTEIEQNES